MTDRHALVADRKRSALRAETAFGRSEGMPVLVLMRQATEDQTGFWGVAWLEVILLVVL